MATFVTKAEYNAARSVARQIAGSNPTLRRKCMNYQLARLRAARRVSDANGARPPARRRTLGSPSILSRVVGAIKLAASKLFGGKK